MHIPRTRHAGGERQMARKLKESKMARKRQIALLFFSVSLVLVASGCKRKAPPPPMPPAPERQQPAPPPRPSATLTAEPGSIEPGQSSTLRWSSTDVTSATLAPAIGPVPSSGSREVFPNQTTEYVITAAGPGGETTARATVTVRASRPEPPPQPSVDWRQTITEHLRDAHFNFNASDIRPDAETALRANADILRRVFVDHAEAQVVIEGHCDERGTSEYNLALGDRRAASARSFLVDLGVPGARLTTASYGKERPQCMESNESCWQSNRRAHLGPAH